MAKFVEKKAETSIYSEQEVWIVNDRFKVNIHLEENEDIYFIRDLNKDDISMKGNSFESIKEMPKLIEILELDTKFQVELWPSIDSCGLLVNKKLSKEVFRLIEKFLSENY